MAVCSENYVKHACTLCGETHFLLLLRMVRTLPWA